MNAKNRLIERLLTVAKKHKVLTYPVLALMAIISFISYFFSWSRGAGKRIIAIIMVMVMLVSQSYFLTTSAENVPDNEKSMEMQDGLQNEYADNSTPNAITASEEMQRTTGKGDGGFYRSFYKAGATGYRRAGFGRDDGGRHYRSRYEYKEWNSDS